MSHDEFLEIVAKAICRARYGHTRGYSIYRLTYISAAKVVLESIDDAIPGFMQVIKGESVIIPSNNQ